MALTHYRAGPKQDSLGPVDVAHICITSDKSPGYFAPTVVPAQLQYFLDAALVTTTAMSITLCTIDVPYPTTNSPLPPTTHLALNVCEALRRSSLCEAGDVKDEDKLVQKPYHH